MRLPLQIGLILLTVATATITEAQVAPPPGQFPPRQLNGNSPGAMNKGYSGNGNPGNRNVGNHPANGMPVNNGNPGAQKPSPAVYQPATATAPAATAPSLLDQPATPAQIHLDAGTLAIKAENSTLSSILHDISAKTGMTIDGLSKDQRIFGSYGPASPRDVLAELLDGVGYNVLMVGDLGSGAPRQLSLSPRASDAPGGNRTTQMARQNNTGNDDQDDSVPEQPDNSPQPPIPAPNQDQPANNQPGQNGVKTPQQMLQELQQMRQQQMQQQQQPPQ